MTIAVPYENGSIFPHFSNTSMFKIYVTKGSSVVATTMMNTEGAGGHSALVGILSVSHIDMVICGGLSGGAIGALAGAGIALVAGATGDADKAVQSYLDGTLKPACIGCAHHANGGECGDSCGEGCGEHGCCHT